jgi:hypothetical protein
MADASRLWGGLLCVAIVIIAVIFLWGISAHSYWAVAIPVAIGFLGVLAMGFWIGWTILTIKTAPPAAEPAPPPSPGNKENAASQASPTGGGKTP